MAYASTIMQGGISAGSAVAICGGIGTGISAAGTTTTDATVLDELEGHMLSTVASGAGVRLSPGNPGDSCWIYNGGANGCKVYPPTGAKFNSLSTNGAITLATNTRADFGCVSATQWTVNLSA